MAKTVQPGLVDNHIEKIVLGVAALILVIVMIGWVIRSPYAGMVSSLEMMPAKDLDSALARLAKNIEGGIEAEKPAPQPLPQWVSQLDSRLNAPFSPNMRDIVNLASGTMPIIPDAGMKDMRRLEGLPELPVVGPALVWTGHELVDMPQMAAMGQASASVARDIYAAHVTAVIDYEALTKIWRQSFQKLGVSTSPVFVNVSAERQERLPDGTWSRPVVIPGVRVNRSGGMSGMTGTDALTLPDPKTTSPEVIRAQLLLYSQRGVAQGILEPDYYPVYWSLPANAGGIQPWGTWRHHLPETAVNLLSTAELDQQVPGQGGGATYSPMGPTGPMPYMPTFGPDGRPLTGPGARAAAGVRVPGMPVPPSAPQPLTLEKAMAVPTLGNQCEAGKVQVWLHDISLEAGKTYMYRLRVEILSPVYGDTNAVKNAQDANQMTLTARSGWSEPKQVESATEIFVSGGTAGTGATAGKVTFDVYRRANGRVFHATFPARMGDPVGEPALQIYRDPMTGQPVRGNVDFSTGCVLVDHDFAKTVQMNGRPQSSLGVMLLTPSGELISRDRYDDSRDARRLKLEKESTDAERAILVTGMP